MVPGLCQDFGEKVGGNRHHINALTAKVESKIKANPRRDTLIRNAILGINKLIMCIFAEYT